MRLVTHRMFAMVASSIFALALAAGPAHADGVADQVGAKTSEAMESYDMMEFEAARKLLGEAVALVRDSGLEGEVAARAYLDLGIVYFSGLGDEASAREAFAAAVAIDPSIEIGVGYRTAELEKMLDAARRESGAGDGVDGVGGDGGGGCGIDGIEHTLVDTAIAGEPRQVRATVGKGVRARRVKLFYRSEGEIKFHGVDLEKQDGCEYVGAIPAEAVRGEFMHYYIAAVNRRGKALANKGTSGSPNIIEIGAGDSDGENPLGGDISRERDDGGDAGPSRIFLGVAVGSGAGYVSGKTELARNDVACCFAPALLHLMPEVGYYLSQQSSVSLAFRMGFPVGANLEGHATFAPAALLRYRHAFDPSGEGLLVSGAIGGGILRHTVKLDGATGDMNTDTTAAGPILLGGGVGYAKPLGGSLQLIAELNAIAGLTAGITEIGSGPGSTRPNNGLQFDFNLGLLIGF